MLTELFSTLKEFSSNDYIAIGTLIIAVFNIFLMGATISQLRLSRKIFVATHRPKVIVHCLESATDADANPRIGAQLHYVNIGDTPAKITEIGSKIIPFQGDPKPGIRIPPQQVSKERLEAGEFGEFPIYSNVKDDELFVEHLRKERGFPAAQLFCVGYIVYEDMLGRRRKTGFCRRFDYDTRSWSSVELSFYEYAY